MKNLEKKHQWGVVKLIRPKAILAVFPSGEHWVPLSQTANFAEENAMDEWQVGDERFFDLPDWLLEKKGMLPTPPITPAEKPF